MIYQKHSTELGHTSLLTILASFITIRVLKKNRKSLETKFSSLCEWFIDNKSSIHFGNNKAKAIFYSPKKIPSKLKISYGDYSLNVQIIFSPS